MKKSFVTKSLCLLLSIVLILGAYSVTAAASSDPVYDSMVEPSESYTGSEKNPWLTYGRIMHATPAENAYKVLSMGDLYRAYGEELPEKFTVYLGKIKCFAYSKSKGRWICVDSQPYPTGIYLYKTDWKGEWKKCKKISYTNSYAKIDLTAEEMKGYCLHFWGKPAAFDKEDNPFFACAFDFWVDEAADGKLTMRNGVDYKDKKGIATINQVYNSRCLRASKNRRTHWGHSVPVKDYYLYNTSSLNELYASDLMEIIPPEKKADKEEPKSEEAKNAEKTENVETSQEVVEVSDSLRVPKLKKAEAGKKTITVKWKKKTAKATGFEIQYSTDKKFSKNVYSVKVNKIKKTSLKIKQLKSNKKYYVRIRTYKEDGSKIICSKWSKKKSVTTK